MDTVTYYTDGDVLCLTAILRPLVPYYISNDFLVDTTRDISLIFNDWAIVISHISTS